MCRSVNVNHGLFDSDTAPRIERSTDFAVLTKRFDARTGRRERQEALYLSAVNRGGKHVVILWIGQREFADQVLVSADQGLINIFIHQQPDSRYGARNSNA